MSRVDKLESSFENLTNDVKTIENQVNALNDDICVISCPGTHLSEHEESDAIQPTANPTEEVSGNSIATDIHTESLAISSSSTDIEQVQLNLTANLNKRLDNLAERFTIATTLLDRLDHKVDRVDAKADRYDIKVDQAMIQLGNLTQQHTVHSGLLEQAEVEGHTLGGEIRNLHEKISVLQENSLKIAELEKDLKDRLEKFIEQVNVREMNRTLLEKPRVWAHPVPNLDGHTNLNKTPHNNGKWVLWNPSVIKAMSIEDLDKWLEFYEIGPNCKDFHFLNDVSRQVKQAILFNFIGGTSANPSFFN